MVRDRVLRRVVVLLVFVVVASLLGAGSSRAADPPPNPNPSEYPDMHSAWPEVGWLPSMDCSLMSIKEKKEQCKKYGLGTPRGFLGLDGKIHCEVLPSDHKLAKKCDPLKIREEITGGRIKDLPPPAPAKPPPDPRLPVRASALNMAWPDVSWIKVNTIDCAGSSPEVYDQCRKYGLLTPVGFLGWDGKVHCELLPDGHALVGNCDPAAIRALITGGRTTDPNVVAPGSQPELRKVFEGLSKAWPTITWIKDDTVMPCGPQAPRPSTDWSACNIYGRYPGLLGADGNVHCEVVPKGDPLASTCDPVKLKTVLLDKSGKSVDIPLGDFLSDVKDTAKTIVSVPGKLLKLPGAFAGWLMKKGLDQLVRAAAESAATLFAKVAEFIFKATAPDLQGVAFMRVYNAVSAVMLALVFVFFVAAVLFNIVSDKFGHLPASVGGLIRAVLGICLAAKVADLMVQLSDACTTSLLGSDAATLTWSSQAFADQLGDMAGTSGMAIVVLLASIFAIIGLIALMVIMLVRSIEMYAGALFGAIAMVGQAHPHTRSWARKWFWNFTALAWSKFVIAALWLLAGNLISQGDSLVAVLSGVGMIWIMVYSPFALMKMFSFVDAQGTGIGSDVGGKMANAAKKAAFGEDGEGDSTPATPAGEEKAPGGGEKAPGASPASQMDANVTDVESGMGGESDDDATDMDTDDEGSALSGGSAGNGADGSTDPLGTTPEEDQGPGPDESPDVPEDGNDPDSLNPGGDMADEAMGPLTGGAGPGSGSSSENEQMAADVALAGAGVAGGYRGGSGSAGVGSSGGLSVGSSPTPDPPSDPVPGNGHDSHSGNEAWGVR
ncbi:hypothetical protein ACFRCG_12720 [Embleya sp. NPDC056575]|uniref:hypothetical protein n=1 Tax=unclassified Embleya TaxID=2699296 RepID=UPI0036CA0B64